MGRLGERDGEAALSSQLPTISSELYDPDGDRDSFPGRRGSPPRTRLSSRTLLVQELGHRTDARAGGGAVFPHNRGHSVHRGRPAYLQPTRAGRSNSSCPDFKEQLEPPFQQIDIWMTTYPI